MIGFVSTRGDKKLLSSMEAILKGIAGDGGLLVPNKLPNVDYKDFIKSKSTFKEISARILNAFFDEYSNNEITNIVDKAYATFDCNDVVPIKSVVNDYIAELFHGETLAFKDVALSVLPRLMLFFIKWEMILIIIQLHFFLNQFYIDCLYLHYFLILIK